MREQRGRVKRARAVVAGTPGLEEILVGDWRKAACFYTRFRITETPCRCGVRSGVFESDGALRTSPAISTRPGTGGFTETWQAMGMSLADASP